MAKDYYNDLGVDKDSSQDQIKKAYRKLAMQFHPDKNSDKQAQQKFKQISQAYQVLSDQQKRKNYDMFGSSQFENGFNWNNFTHGFQFNDIFESFFNRGNRNPFSNRQQSFTQTIQIQLTLEQIYLGTQKFVQFAIMQTCKECQGTGSQDKELQICNQCNGAGQITNVSQMGFMTFKNTTMCNKCQGSGKTIKNVCIVCSGNKYVQKNASTSLNLPRGLLPGTQILILNDGVNIIYGRIQLVNQSHYQIYMDENSRVSIKSKINISFYQAITGVKKEIDYFGNQKIEITVPQGSESQKEVIIKNKGLYNIHNNTNGDLILVINVDMPKYSQLNKQQRKSLDNFNKNMEKI